jgi:sugar phosphate isomerase/epimerase
VTGFIGCENFGRFFPWPYSKGWSDMEGEFVERWGKILDKFAEYGVKFAHEPHPNELVYNVETAQRAVELMDGRKEFGFNFDPANLTYLGIDVENFIDTLAGRIYHVHAKDGEIVAHNVRRSGSYRKVTGSGSAAVSLPASRVGDKCHGRKSSPSFR